jgi:uncharacterized protein
MRRRLFADALYWIALAHPGDQWHQPAHRVARTVDGIPLVTTQEVLTEFVNALSKLGPNYRRIAAGLVDQLRARPDVKVVAQTARSFTEGLELYRQRPDKSYSLTDCISFNTMRRLGLTEALTHDRHYQQEGFLTLINDNPT